MGEQTAELLWVGRDGPRRGPTPVLSLPAITEAAVAIADAEGLGAVTMQSVADTVGFTKMALYRHVRSKDELVAVMVEHAYRDPPTFRSGTDWRRRLETWVQRLAELWRQHPWLPAASSGHRTMGPREMAWIESVLSAMDGLLLSGAERIDAAFLLSGHVRNTSSLDTAGTHPWNEPVHRELLRERRAEFGATASAMDTTPSRDSGRRFGLNVILDGLQALHERRA